MKTKFAVILAIALSAASCKRVQPVNISPSPSAQLAPSSDVNPLVSLGREEAERLMAKIYPGTTVSDMQRAFPRAPLEQSPVAEHGGVWFSLLVSQNYYIQFRAAHPRAGDVIEHCVINYSPRLRSRKDMTIISGEERAW